jgi:hypothetical protein
MEEKQSNLIHTMAQNYCVFLADFPSDLKPTHLDVPAGEQASLLVGLSTLHTTIGKIYEHFSLLVTEDRRWEDREYCRRAIEAPVKLLWAIGAFGQLVQGSEGLELRSSREELDQAIKKCGCKDPAKAFGVLETVGFQMSYCGVDGFPSLGGYKKCASAAVRYPAQNDPLLRAMVYYTKRLPQKKIGRKEKGIIFEVFLRADFRPLLPNYTFHIPHLPATEEEVTRTFSPTTLEVWNALTGFMADHYPQYRLYYRVPYPGGRRWIADYSIKDNDYGLWSIFIEELGISVRIVLIEGTINNMLDHVGELSPHFQENYLNAVACKDCSHCGKHVIYTHGNHIHRLCKSPWFISPYLHLEDLPDIERLIDFRLTNLQ